MKDLVIVSCCYSEARPEYYARYADRLETSLAKWAPGIDVKMFRDGWPPGSPPHGEMHYGFKFYAMKHCFERGYRRAIWMDAGTEMTGPIDPIIRHLDEHGTALIRGWDLLGEWISDEALAYHKIGREEVMKMKLAGGCLIGIDLDKPLGARFWEEYGALTGKRNLFMCFHSENSAQDGIMKSVLRSDGDGSIISRDPRVKGHRSDEASFSVIMHQLGIVGIPRHEWKEYARTYQC